ncbi:PAS domain S-box-containing protein/diguanylate cyclase (GGDEF) domain-containing protein [Cohnella sp. OV330]|uniref:diguanylate cyclase n=1 Tax=Cohnella sp. OV330 TaxID=1855288 RepID=UPI0008F1420F|nr:diguanylate cyclase [Cohnella sp. OV330]SFA71622.1 PAS domain S-box-containing protein/diguanylate cyclase (GGDEF) domain-containing protein [Cohnella sp. OV330]
MINTLIANFALLTAFLFFFNALYGKHEADGDKPRRIVVYGAISYGLFALVLMYFSVRLDAHALLDFRQLMIVCSAAFGGPIAALITAAFVMLGRILMFGGVNDASLIACASALVLAAGGGAMSRWLPRRPGRFWLFSIALCMLCTAITFAILLGEQAMDILPPFFLVMAIGGIIVSGLTAYFSTANRLQLELRASERRYRQLHMLQQSILQSASDVAIVAADLTGRVTLFNKGAEKLLGYDADDVVGRGILRPQAAAGVVIAADKTGVAQAGARDIDALSDFVQRMMYGSEDEHEWTIKRRDGIAFAANVIVSHVLDSDGEVIGYMSVSTDITERKLAEEKLMEANSLLQKLSLLDGLTGIANRRRFDQALRAAWTTAVSEDSTMSLILFDIDYFKKYNDAYGHQAGDDCLIQVAAVAMACLRAGSDTAARYGGEEFGVILPGADAEEALVVAERIRAAIFDLAIPHIHSPTGVVTLSLGIACQGPGSATGEQRLIALADAALYEAKQSGRNRAAMANSSVGRPSAN